MQSIPSLEQHSPARSLLLHLLPGLLITIVYLALVRPLQQAGYPSLLALVLAIVLVLLPFELGLLLYLGNRRNGRFSLAGILRYRDPIPFWQYLLWVPALFVLLGLVFTLLKPVDMFLKDAFFAAWPAPDAGLDGHYSRAALLVTYTLLAIFGAVVGPIVEEFYFRGYLLPRMGYAGKWAPALHSFLFALYHLFTPWMIVTRTLALLPLIYAVRRRNLYISIAVHVLINLVDVIAGFAFIASMAG